MNNADRLIERLIARPLRPRVRLYRGLPPQLTSGDDLREQMPSAVVVLIEPKPSGIFLVRFAADGQVVGDTWHRTIEDAQEQATFEFGSLLSNWMTVPPGVEDLVAFGLGVGD
jgi:hypothetical protein